MRVGRHPPGEDAAAIGGALLLRASLVTDGQVVTALLDAIVALLTGKERRQRLDRAGLDGDRGRVRAL
jgi:hypothetical protein